MDPEPLTSEELAEVKEAEEEIARGEYVEWDEVKKELGLDDPRLSCLHFSSRSYTLSNTGGIDMAETKITPIRIPADLLKSIDAHVGRRQRSKFILDAIERELLRQRQLEAMKEAAGCWKAEDHPEIPDTIDGMNEYTRKLRAEEERRDD